MQILFKILFLILLNTSYASAASISIQVSGFIGRYNISGGADKVGNSVVTLNPGNYTLNTKFGGTGGSTGFTVNGDGTVVSSDSTIISYSGSTLTLNTLPIYFNIGDYNNKFTISSSVYQGASGTFYLPAKLSVSIDVPGSNAVAVIKSDENGYVTVLSGSEKIAGGQDEITFNTVSVNVVPGSFDGIYAFFGGSYISGFTSHKLLPNTSYTLRTSTAYNIGSIQTNTIQLVANKTANLKTENNTVYFYKNPYNITPPSGYAGAWQIYLQGSNTGTASEWLLPGMQSRLIVANVVYNFIADTDCSSFAVSTAVGTFNFVCDDLGSLIHPNLSTNYFNNKLLGYTINKTDGRLSTSIADYSLNINGTAHTLSSYFLTNDTFTVNDALVEGRNAIILDGEDSSSDPFQLTPVFWAGSGQVTVQINGTTDTVTLTVEQVIDGIVYSKSIAQQAVSNVTVFNYVPRIENGTVYISTNRSKKSFYKKIPQNLIIQL